MSDADRDDDLAERVADLEATLEALRDELGPPRGPLGLPRPPTPREVLRVADEYAIPAAIAVLEANIRMLELLRAVLRATRGAPREGAVRERASELGRETLSRLDRALSELQAAVEDADLPRDAEARGLLEEARALNAEIDERLSAAGDGSAGEPGERDAGENEAGGTTVDVEAELESIREEVGDGSADDGDEEKSGNGSQ